MKKLLTCIACLAGALMAQAQQVNGGFDETWVDCVPWDSKGNTKTKGSQPVGWTISNVIGMNGTGATQVGMQVTGYAETGYAVQLTNTANPFSSSQIVPAYMTLGTSWATAKASITGSVSAKDGGTFGGVAFTHQPDALRFYYKRSHASGSTERASVVAYLWKGTYTQASVPGNTSMVTPTKVTMTDRDRNILGKTTAQGGTVTKTDDAACLATIEHYIEGDASDWTECLVPFTYQDGYNVNNKPEKLNIILAANDYFNTTVVEGNSLTVDNVSLVYYSDLSKVMFNGAEVPVAADMDLSAFVYDENKLALTARSPFATVEKSYDASTAVLTVTVKGNDWSATNLNQQVYTLRFAKVVDFTEPLTVSIDGETLAPQATTFQLIERSSGYAFSLENFTLNMGGMDMLIGNIYLPNLQKDGNVFTTSQTIAITGGIMDEALQAVPVEMTAVRNGEHMTAHIDIDMTESLGQLIKVVLAPEVTLTGAEAPTVLGWQNVTLTRSFKAGWNTLCLPFDFSVHAFGTDESGENIARAQAFIATGANGLTFSEVTELEANKPYLIYFAQDTSSPVYFGVNVTSLTPVAVTQGDFTFVGTYAETQMEGKYGVVNIDDKSYIRVGDAGSVLNSTRAYFTTTLPGIKEMPLLLGGEVDAIESVPTASAVAGYDVLTLTGVQVRKGAVSLKGLPKGLYIVNGKKQIVK